MSARAAYRALGAAAAIAAAAASAATAAAGAALRLDCAFELPCPDGACRPGLARGELELAEGILWISGLGETWGIPDLADARRQGFYSRLVSEREGTRVLRVESPVAQGVLFAWADGRAALSLSVPGATTPQFQNFGGRCEVRP